MQFRRHFGQGESRVMTEQMTVMVTTYQPAYPHKPNGRNEQDNKHEKSSTQFRGRDSTDHSGNGRIRENTTTSLQI
jgi:hypothetical protein